METPTKASDINTDYDFWALYVNIYTNFEDAWILW